jgi:hypothetical protein
MSAFPTLASGRLAKYPISRTVNKRTGMVSFMDDSEQRWQLPDGPTAFSLAYSNISAADMQTLQDFFAFVKGSFQPFQFTFLDDTYDCVFDQDELVFTENRPNRYSTTVRLKQIRS